MYKTLKELQEALSDEALYKYADKAADKNAEEIIEMLKSDNIEISIEAAKECVDCLKGIEIISNEELENVAGGTCYSKGIAAPNGIVRDYVIVTFDNSCPGATWHYNDEFGYYEKDTCSWCTHHFGNVPMYCSVRWDGHEALNPGFDSNNRECCDNMDPFVDGPRNW